MPSGGGIHTINFRAFLVLLKMPLSPIAYASSSTRRVETPPIHASWMTATSAFSEVLRGSRKPRKYLHCRGFGTFRFSVPRRVSRARSRHPLRHDQLQQGRGNSAQKVAAVLLGQKFGKFHVGLGHRGPLWFVVEASKLHPTTHLDGRPTLHR